MTIISQYKATVDQKQCYSETPLNDPAIPHTHRHTHTHFWSEIIFPPCQHTSHSSRIALFPLWSAHTLLTGKLHILRNPATLSTSQPSKNTHESPPAFATLLLNSTTDKFPVCISRCPQDYRPAVRAVPLLTKRWHCWISVIGLAVQDTPKSCGWIPREIHGCR